MTTPILLLREKFPRGMVNDMMFDYVCVDEIIKRQNASMNHMYELY